MWAQYSAHPVLSEVVHRRDGAVLRPDGRRLHELAAGETASVLRVSDHDPDLLRYLADLGVVVGTNWRVVAKRDFAGSMTVVRLTEGAETGPATDLATVAANSIWVSLA